MLDPVSTLAFEMAASKGVFALLLGSGVSRSAKIPTGWDITLDLVRKIAGLHGEDPGANPEAWYLTRFGEAPDYARLLDQLATTPAMRQTLIASYIEPSASEPSAKLPTKCHRAIALLMKQGVVRLVLTTNFDRLLEIALADVGVHATVISTPDQLSGAVPLVHAGPVIVKVHGDYKDQRIRNTQTELASYEPALDNLLDRVFDEFGLVVCGWSADWDEALRAAIERAPSRRYPMYWAARGTPSEVACALIARRGAKLVPIGGADEFFEALGEKVAAVQRLAEPHPLSTDLAIAMVQEYLSEDKHRIRLHKLVTDELTRATARLDTIEVNTGGWDAAAFPATVERLETATTPLLHLAFQCGMWAEGDQVSFWGDAVRELAHRRGGSGVVNLLDLLTYPAALVLHTYCLGAVVGGRIEEFGRVATAELKDRRGVQRAAGDLLNAGCFLTQGQDLFKYLPGYQHHPVPASERIASLLRSIAKHELRSDAAFDEAFGTVELAFAAGYMERVSGGGGSRWAPIGRLKYLREIPVRLISAATADFERLGAQSALVRMAGLTKAPNFSGIEALFQGW